MRLGAHSVSKTDGSSCGVRFLRHLLVEITVPRTSGVVASLSRRRAGVRIPSVPLPLGGFTEVCPTLARGLTLNQVYVGSIPTASTVDGSRFRLEERAGMASADLERV